MRALRSGLVVVSMLAGAALTATQAAESSYAGAVSQYRAAHGLTAVKTDAALTRMAASQAAAMARAGSMSHSVDGEFYGRLRKSGFHFVRAGENLGEGYRSFGAAMEGWKGSDGHRANLLIDGATRVGVASARGGNGQMYWAMVLAAPAPKGPPVRYFTQREAAEPPPAAPARQKRRAAERKEESPSPLAAIKKLLNLQ
jgi:Cysteine-rich secretory protein family